MVGGRSQSSRSLEISGGRKNGVFVWEACSWLEYQKGTLRARWQTSEAPYVYVPWGRNLSLISYLKRLFLYRSSAEGSRKWTCTKENQSLQASLSFPITPAFCRPRTLFTLQLWKVFLRGSTCVLYLLEGTDFLICLAHRPTGSDCLMLVTGNQENISCAIDKQIA